MTWSLVRKLFLRYIFKWHWMNTGEIRTPKVCAHRDRFPLYYTYTILNVKVGKKERKILLPKVKSNTSPGVRFTLVGYTRNYSLIALLFTSFSPEVAGEGKEDAHVSICPSFPVPSLCWIQPILFLPCHLWSVNMERRSDSGVFRGEYQSRFPLSYL